MASQRAPRSVGWSVCKLPAEGSLVQNKRRDLPAQRPLPLIRRLHLPPLHVLPLHLGQHRQQLVAPCFQRANALHYVQRGFLRERAAAAAAG